ncbi:MULTISPECIES: ABC transporter permease [Pyrobaculum]|uniref:Nucleoside ABC transporter membrane protein n=2 Tax=Pyrobaculum arsenaticum TaxID=121277 RepID=A4WL80_PYRAR|nr:ABC transporter permease [Pyrobaculum arsenaticum]ABP51147.1 nucleoside ABC transporter membrane protein [Pyrobaculum arsenaticum DSM 13514]MCY0891616.1 ABC transporter permease [Pyrobaculum arsenaticum]NYR15129.1 ABC transporter permease [Pyrobaculum arsenaticum]
MIDLLLLQALLAATPILLAAVGEILTERSGVVNIGLEGLMLLGALAGPLFVDYLKYKVGAQMPDPLWPLLAILASAFVGIVVGLVHGYISTYLAGDQIISGVAINLFAAGAVAYGIQAYWGVAGYKQVPDWAKADPYVVATFALALAVFTWFLLFKTRLGIVIRACGEDPESAFNMGVDVNKVRLLATVAGSALAAVAGAYLSIAYLSVVTKEISAGRGFIALANVVFANWNPLLAIAGAYIFGFFDALSYWLQTMGVGRYEITRMVPYIATLLIVAGVMGRAKPPRALGKPFKRE